jgi:hypothetical protein
VGVFYNYKNKKWGAQRVLHFYLNVTVYPKNIKANSLAIYVMSSPPKELTKYQAGLLAWIHFTPPSSRIYNPVTYWGFIFHTATVGCSGYDSTFPFNCQI